MSRTHFLVLGHLPKPLAGIVRSYFASDVVTPYHVAKEGRYEDCLGFTSGFGDMLLGACKSGYIAIADLAIARGGYPGYLHRRAAAKRGHSELVARVDEYEIEQDVTRAEKECEGGRAASARGWISRYIPTRDQMRICRACGRRLASH